MSRFEDGVSGYIEGVCEVHIFFPIDMRGNSAICCEMCRMYSTTTRRCRLNDEVCEYPNKFVGSHCPLEMIEKEN